MLEAFGNVIVVIIIWLLTRATTSGILVGSLSIYFTLLPRAFLMNTSDNKNRIVEYGWKNVLMNSFGMASNKCSKVSPENFVTSKGNIEKNINVTHKLEVEDLEENSSTPSGSDTSCKGAKLSNSSSSNHHDRNTMKRSKAHASTKSYNDSVEYPFSHLDVKQLMVEDVKSTLVNTLIDHLKNSLDNEEKYIFYFRQLINVNKDIQKGTCSNEIILKSYYEDKNIQKFSNGKSVNPRKFKNSKRSTHVRRHNVSSIDNVILNFCTELEYDIKERNHRRVDVLRKFDNVHNNWEQFDLFLEEMIDMEESFIK